MQREEPLSVKVRFYGRLADVIGREIELDVAPCTAGDLRRRLAERHPAASDILRRSRAIAGDVVIGDDQLVPDDSEIELLPQVCGG
jgi:molybdopterin converting factor small subunit